MSELIDVAHGDDPAYGEIHVGLYMAIMSDVLDRTRQIIQAEALTTHLPNTPRPAEPSRPEIKTKMMSKAAIEQATARPLALLRMQISQYNSPVPASFIRLSGGTAHHATQFFNPEEYFCLTLTSPIASGATGDVYAGSIEMLSSTGEILSLSHVAVKFAFEPEQQNRMRNEAEIYEHLSSSGATGIPILFGLFQDSESDTLALIMSHVGRCLVHRIPLDDDQDPPFFITPSER
ncbi:hypothetical protein DXG03_008583 [Asterophora parasitica]|uniref:Uncharacterized protein n=1 Tax=Asterophora parasitica TaxID=117018 RepID=A0A9P7G087_9AGAR|nr:hypothetical protein DXG03_008583 [Asterophora parasitica]